MDAYGLVDFKDSTHSLHMALSSDGYSFSDVNKENPVISGETIALLSGFYELFKKP